MAVTEDQVIKALEPVQDPELRRGLVELGMVQYVLIEDTKVEILIALTIPGCPLKAQIQESVEQALRSTGRILK